MQTPALEKSVEGLRQLPLGVVSRGSEQLEWLRFRVGVANCGPWRSVMLLAARKTNNPRQDTLTCLPPHNQATRHVRTLKRTLIALLNTALRGPSRPPF